jgi:hypothetical protein
MPRDVQFFDPKAEAEVRRKRALAQQLFKQGEQPTSSEMVSGIVVKRSPLEGLAKALSTGVGGYAEGRADKLQTEDAEKKQKLLAEAISQYGTNPSAALEMLMQSPATSDLGAQLAQGVDAPSAVREYQFYNQLPQAEQEQFLNVKRAAQIQNLGGQFGVYNPVQGNVAPIQGAEIMPSPAQQDDINRKNREAEDMFNRGLDVKEKALAAAERLLENESGVRANRGGISTLFRNVSDSAIDAQADLETLSNLLTTENLGLLKGVLSDTDMKILASIGSGEIQGSDEKTLGAIRRMQEALSGKVAAGRQVQREGYSDMPPLLSDPDLQFEGLPPYQPSTPRLREDFNKTTQGEEYIDMPPPLDEMEQKRRRLEELRARAQQ